MDNVSKKEMHSSSYNYELLANTQVSSLQKNSICKRFGFKKILLFLAVLQLLCILYLYKSNYWKISSPAKEANKNAYDYEENRGQFLPNSVFHLPLTRPTDMSKYYVEVDEDVSCMIGGIISEDDTRKKCLCLEGWTGSDCGIPYTIWDSGFLKNGTAKGIKVQRRQQPRRIVHSLWFNGNFKRLRVYLKTYQDVVDLFIIGFFPNNSNSKQSLNEITEKHKLSFIADKLMYIPLTESEVSSNNIAIIQYEIWKYAKTILSEVRPDDLLIMSDIFNQPYKEVLMFLKLYDGYGEPLFFHLRQADVTENINSTLNTSNQQQNLASLSTDIVACHIEFLRFLCNYDARLVWLHKFLKDKNYKVKIRRYEDSLKISKFSPWNVGSVHTPAGIYANNKSSKIHPPTSLDKIKLTDNVNFNITKLPVNFTG